MEYSKIKNIRVKNFNCIGDVTIDFTESPIISLVGDNDSGKSSIIDGFTVSAYHANPNNQKESIREGTVGFGIMIELEDGHKITRIKTAKSNEYKVEYPDGRVWATDKIDVGAGVPLQVQEILGCIKEEETKEFLHVRTYRDLMLFVTTSAGTNYKVMYGALKAEHISKAIKNGSNRINTLRSFKNEREVVLNTLEQNYNDTKIYDIKPVLAIRDRVNKRFENIKKLDRTVESNRRLESYRVQLGKSNKILEANLQVIDEVLLDKLLTSKKQQDSLNGYTRKYNRLKVIEDLKPIDLSVIGKIDRAIASNNEVRTLNKKARVYSQLKDCVEIDTSTLNKIDSTIAKNEVLKEKKEAYRKYGRVGELPNEINLSVINKLDATIEKYKLLQDKKKELSRYSKISEITESVNTAILSKIDIALEKLEELNSRRDKLNQLNLQINEYTRLIKESGIKTAVCSHCGNDVYVE